MLIFTAKNNNDYYTSKFGQDLPFPCSINEHVTFVPNGNFLSNKTIGRFDAY